MTEESYKTNIIHILSGLIEKIKTDEIRVDSMDIKRHLDPIFSAHFHPPVGMKTYGYTITVEVFAPDVVMYEDKVIME